MFEPQRIGQVQRNVNTQQHQQGSVAGGKRQARGQQQRRQRQRQRGRHGAAGQRPVALARMPGIAGAVQPVIEDVDHARKTAERGKGLQHLEGHGPVAPALAEHQPGEHKGVFQPLVGAHQGDEAEQ